MDAPGNVPDSINCHSCGAILDLTGQTGFTHVECQHCGAPSVVPLKFGDFLLLNVIGTGGTGTVYKAIDVPLNRYLALKVLRSNLASDPALVARFSGEARATATVNHPNIAQVYSFGEIDHWYYIAPNTDVSPSPKCCPLAFRSPPPCEPRGSMASSIAT